MVTAGSGPGPWPDMPYIAGGRWYQTPQQGTATALAVVLNQCYLAPFIPGWECILSNLAINVSVLGIGSSVRAGLVYGTTDTCLPSTLAVDFGTVSATTAGAKTWAGLNYQIEQRPYFMAIAVTGALCTLSARTGIDVNVAAPSVNFADANAYTMSGVTGAFPTDFTSATTVGIAPIAAFQLT